MQMKKLVSVILAVCMLVSMFTILPLSAGAETATKTITVGVVDYLDLQGDYEVHYWGGAEPGDAAATALNTQKDKSVGQDYWQGEEKTYNMFEATIPADATGFKFHIGETWFGDDGNTAESNAVYVFEYGDNYLAYYDNETPAAPETQVPTTAPETQAPTIAPASEAPVADTITVYFTDALNWGAANIYYWNGGSDWPGPAMTVYQESNDFGQKVYSATIPADVEGIIFNANGNQTVDIKTGIADGKGWYTEDETDEVGHYKVVEYTVTEPETTAPSTAPETTAPETTAPASEAPIIGGTTYYIVGDMNEWQINEDYALTKNSATEDDEYYFHGLAFESEQGFKVIGYNGSIQGGNTTWYPDGADNDCVIHEAGTYDIYFRPNYDGGEDWFYSCIFVTASEEPASEPETQAPSTAPETTAPETTAPVVGEEVTLYFTNNKGWGEVKAHMWKEDGASTEWPGVAATYVKDNDYGEAIYSATINTATYDHVIFNDGGNGGQTANIAVADAVAGGCGVYCLDTQDGEGHYNVGFYEYSAEPSSEPSSEPVVGGPTYYIVGGMTNWQINEDYALTKNDASEDDEYMFEGLALTTTSMFKVVRLNGSIQGGDQAWYPDGMGNNYGENGEIDHDGMYTIYFRPGYNGGEGWFYNCIYVAEFVAPVTEPVTEPETEPSTEPSTEPVEHTIAIVDGKYYVDGEIVKNAGLIEYEDNYYYVRSDGSVFTGGKLNVTEAKANGLLPAGTYVFDDEGKMVNSGTIVNGYYYEKGKIARGVGVVQINSGYYFVQKDGSVAVNAKRLGISEAKTNGLIEPGYYNSDENGKLDITGIFGSKGYYFRDGVVILGAGVVQYKGGLYFVMNDGTVAKSRKLGVSAAKSNGLVAPGYYEFDETGKMLTDGIVNGYYYENGVVQLGKGIIEIDGDFYFVRTDGSIYKNGKINVPEAKTNGLIEAGSYSFDADGKLIAE